MKIFTLAVEDTYDFDLFGLVSSSREHTLAWQLNRALHLRLVKQNDYPCLIGNQEYFVSNYLCEVGHCTVRLLRNRFMEAALLKKPFLAPDIKEYDYLLHVSNGTGPLAPDGLLGRLTALPAVQYACQFDPNTLKFKENLLF